MAQREIKLRRGELAYCLAVCATVLGEIVTIVIGKSPLAALIGESLVLVLAALFPVGVAVWVAYRRLAAPSAVIGCVLLSGLWCLMLVAWNW